MAKGLQERIFLKLDEKFRKIDKTHIRRTNNLRLIPDYKNRRGGKLSYAEWAHVIGIFQTIIYQNLDQRSGNHILDIGCGTGLLGIASEPFTSGGGSYTGIDVMTADIDFCQQNFTSDNYNFIHFDVANPTYAGDQSSNLKPWPVEDGQYDMVTALSVWTHLREEDARYYFREISRVLKPGGKAIITFFYLDEEYQASLALRSDAPGRFHSTNQKDWIFNTPAYNSENWYTLEAVRHPEDAIAVTKAGINQLLSDSGLKLSEYHSGNWKEIPGLYFQDVLIFEKPAG